MSRHFSVDSLEWMPVRPEITRAVFGKTLFDKTIKIVLTRVEPGGKFEAHRDDYGHLFYFLNGQGTVTIGDRRIEVLPGLVVEIARGEDHAYENTGREDLILISANIKE